MTSSPQSRLFSNEAETALVVEKLATLSYTEAFARGLVDALTALSTRIILSTVGSGFGVFAFLPHHT